MSRRLLRAALAALALVLGARAEAASPAEQARAAELDRVRAEVAGQVQLSAYDLVDELVYGWTREPVFAERTPVVLAGVTVPVGLGTGLQALVENHLSDVLLQNPTANLQLVHCPACTAVVVHSGPEGTVVSRGVDNPQALGELGVNPALHALFVDIEAEGAWLVLRARITGLNAELPVVWSRTLSGATSAAPLLREASALKSADEARAEYLDTLEGQGPITVPVRLAVRTYAFPNRGGIAPPPFPWLQSGVELSPTNARVWSGSVIAGYSYIPQAWHGVMVQGRFERLLTGRTRSLTRPDLYAFVGVGAIGIWGPATGSFRNERLNADEVLTDADGAPPRTAFTVMHFGGDLRLGNRIGFAVFLETIPSLQQSRNMGSYVDLLGLRWQSVGAEVSVCF